MMRVFKGYSYIVYRTINGSVPSKTMHCWVALPSSQYNNQDIKYYLLLSVLQYCSRDSFYTYIIDRGRVE